MSRWEFMRKLEELLSDISPNEREEALQYYNDYFNDAGRENEQEVIHALGSPEQVAKIVRDGLGDGQGCGEFTENGFSNSAEQKNEIAKRSGENQNAPNEGFGEEKHFENTTAEPEGKKDLPTWAIVLIVIGCVLGSPLIISAFGALVGVIAAAFGIVLGFGIAAIALYVTAIALAVMGFGCIVTSPLSGIGMIGGGCICAALGILFMLLTVFIAGKCIPGICQGIAYIFGKLFGKGKGVKS